MLWVQRWYVFCLDFGQPCLLRKCVYPNLDMPCDAHFPLFGSLYLLVANRIKEEIAFASFFLGACWVRCGERANVWSCECVGILLRCSAFVDLAADLWLYSACRYSIIVVDNPLFPLTPSTQGHRLSGGGVQWVHTHHPCLQEGSHRGKRG